ncbi:MAG: indole-3-glycerol phosphate synthase TrpC [Devosiaceae bacterium]|nr:indole-3-glycerol phosphate synthase TrpC [Devosiaceae bacterium]
MANILDRIIDYKKEEVLREKAQLSLSEVEALAKNASAPRGFEAALRKKVNMGEFALIAEVKKASPSKGLIRKDFNPSEIAKAYENGGATCLSVLTDKPSFQGSPEYLITARNACALPVLRKDFMIDPYQVVQARSWGADAILIIMAALDVGLAGELAAYATDDWGMDVLCEVHNQKEMDLALALDLTLIGINNRNLKAFETDLAVSEELAKNTPNDRLLVSESGISTHEDLIRLQKSGINSFLVGESLMRQNDVAKATKTLLNG